MFTVLTCIREEHDYRLVLAAALMCVIASVTALRVHRRNRSGVASIRWLAPVMTGLVAGAGVWATHFIAMLAYHPGLPIDYDLNVTVASLAVAIIGCGSGFSLAAREPNLAGQVGGGVIVGLSIASMHFVGIAAIESAFDVAWRWAYVGASITIAVAGSVGALMADRRTRDPFAWIVPPLLLVLAITGLHFTAMTAIDLMPDLTRPAVAALANRTGLALMVGLVTVAIIGVAAGLVVVEARGREAGLRNLEAAFQGVPAGLAMFDGQGKLVIWNEAYARLMANFAITPFFGATRQDLARQIVSAGIVVPEDGDAEAWAAGVAERRASGEVRGSLAPTGAWLRMELTRLPNGATVSVVTDITAAHAAAEAMEAALGRAEAANHAKSEFLANMSHEIRTPLNGILGMTQVMEADELTEAQRSRLGVVRESGSTLLAILDDILDLSKIQAGKLELDVGDVDVARLVRNVAAAFDGAASAKDIRLSFSINEGVAGLWRGDGLRIRQILSNLVGNAVKFTQEGEVRLSVERSNQGFEFRVIDTGIGIAEEHLPLLFDKFAQADASTTRRYGGSGLGLAICHELAAMMGGSVTVRSRVGEGSCFTFALPSEYVRPSQQDVAAAPVTSALEGQRLRILAAEDNGTNQLVLRSLLQPLDCDLVVVGNGREAVEAAKAGAFDAILMDIQMPEMNGVEAAIAIHQFEAEAGRRRTPIVALSANVMKHQLDEYAAAGIEHWVAKPIELEKLYAGLDAALSSDQPGRDPAARDAA